MVISPGWFDRSPCGTGTSARMAQLHARGEPADLATITADLAARDARDANRAVAPLKSVPEAGGFFLETTTRSIDESVAAVLRAHLDRLQP